MASSLVPALSSKPFLWCHALLFSWTAEQCHWQAPHRLTNKSRHFTEKRNSQGKENVKNVCYIKWACIFSSVVSSSVSCDICACLLKLSVDLFTPPPRPCCFNISIFWGTVVWDRQTSLMSGTFLMPYKDIAQSAPQACQECCLFNSQCFSLSFEIDNLHDLVLCRSSTVCVCVW